MRKNLMVIIALFVSSTLIAQTLIFQDNFDAYSAGNSIASQSANWHTFSDSIGNIEDALVTGEGAFSGPNSLNIRNQNDIIYSFGNKVLGTYSVEFKMLIKSGNGAYLAFFHEDRFRTAFAFYFNENKQVIFKNGSDSLELASFNTNEWFTLKLAIDLVNDRLTIYVNNLNVGQFVFSLSIENLPKPKFGCIEFFGLNNEPAYNIQNSDFLIDDFKFTEVTPPIQGNGCNQLNYLAVSASASLTNYTDLGILGSVISTSGNYDDANSAPVDIGFTFNFDCQNYTKFILNTNGFIKLGINPPSTPALFYNGTRNSENGIFNSPDPADVDLVIPFNHDLTAGTATPEYRVYTSGSAPDRICTIQFKNLRDKTFPQQYDNLEFQILLYETSNIIEFIYGEWIPSGITYVFKTSACGLKGSTISDEDILAVNKGSAWQWKDVIFRNANYSTTATLNFGNPPDRPIPYKGTIFRFRPTLPPTAPTEVILSRTEIPTLIRQGTIISRVSAKDINKEDTLAFELVSGYGDNIYFEILNGNLVTAIDMYLPVPKDLNLRIRVTDNTGLYSEFDVIVHANTNDYYIQNLNISDIDEMSVINENVLWVESQYNQLARTVDGGENWTLIHNPEAITSLGPIFAINELTAFLVVSVGNPGIFKTTDGGLSWVKQISAYNESSFPDIIYFWDENNGFTMGDTDSLGYIEIYTTQNGGQDWIRVPQDKVSSNMVYTVNTMDIVCVYKDTVWVAAPGLIFRSADKGYTWDAFDLPVPGSYANIQFINGRDGILSFVGGTDKNFYTTHDGGETWSQLITDITLNGYSQHYSLLQETSTIAMTDLYSLYFTNDLGTTWEKSDINFPQLLKIVFYNDRLLWAGGLNGQVYKIYRNNLDPLCNGELSDQEAYSEKEFTWVVPTDIFTDGNNDELNFMALDIDGNELPAWLEFNPLNLSFTATPAIENVGDYSIMVIAADKYNAFALDTFKLSVLYYHIIDEEELNDQISVEVNIDTAILVIPLNIFEVADLQGIVTYSATLLNGDPLPRWIEFDPVSLKIKIWKDPKKNMNQDIITVLVKAEDQNNKIAFLEISYDMTSLGVYAIENNSFNIYPNPVSDHLYVQNSDMPSKHQIKITDLSGRLVYFRDYEKSQLIHDIDVSRLEKGLYIIHLIVRDKVSVKSFIVN